MINTNNYSFDIEVAKNLTEAFAESCRVPCDIIDDNGNRIYHSYRYSDLRVKCHRLLHKEMDCEHLQLYGAGQSERFGGRYIYSCPAGMGWISVPVIADRRAEVSISVGPFLLSDYDDYIAELPDMKDCELVEVTELLNEFPKRSPKELSDLSMVVLAIAF